MNKIIGINNLKELNKQLKDRQVVLVGGCFDILHLGHVRFLKAAKKYGLVIVALENDQTLTKHKGHLRPIHKQDERAEVLAELTSVDYILLLPYFSSDADYFELTQKIRPAVIAITDGDTQLANKQKQAKAVNGKVIVIPKIETPSTTQLAKLLGLS